MTLRKISKDQPENFEFTKKSLDEANKIIEKYPEGKQQSAVCRYCTLLKNKMITGYHYQL